MNLMLLLDMAASAAPDRVAVQHGDRRLTCAEVLTAVAATAAVVRKAGASHLAYLGTNHPAFPVALFGAAAAGVPFIPLNYRLSDDQLADLLGRHENLFVIADEACRKRLADLGVEAHDRDELLDRALAAGAEVGEWPNDPEAVALLLYTSGTTSAPKAAVLRHRHLVSYVIGSVEFGAADEADTALVSVPPYHVAGVANLLSNLYLGRRIVYLEQFDAETWLETVRAEGVTHAMVVPTMLARIVDVLAGESAADAGVPTLRSLSYGGARTPATVLQRAVALFPDTDFTNAYGLTETSSTIAVLGPDDHRAAAAGGDPLAVARLGSAGRLLPGIEVEVRGDDGTVLGAGEVGELWVRGEQVSGEYLGVGSSLDEAGWFPTRDRGSVDAEGYLFVEGRSDDTIIRGGENIAPAEIEETILTHPGVAECAVVGVPDEEWGQRIAAVVVRRPGAAIDGDEVRAWVRERLRGSKTPDEVVFRDDLPHTDTGKLLRRVVVADLTT